MVYLFTYHAYATWLPDRPQGYVKRKQGVLPTDPQAAKAYRSRMKDPIGGFDRPARRVVLDIIQATQFPQQLGLRAVSIDQSHIHVLVSWTDDRTPAKLHAGLRESITRGLNTRVERRPKWLSAGGDQKHVADDAHFNHLLNEYLPEHHGLIWRYTHPTELIDNDPEPHLS